MGQGGTRDRKSVSRSHFFLNALVGGKHWFLDKCLQLKCNFDSTQLLQCHPVSQPDLEKKPESPGKADEGSQQWEVLTISLS